MNRRHRWSKEEENWIRTHLPLPYKEMALLISAEFQFVCTVNMIKIVISRRRIRPKRMVPVGTERVVNGIAQIKISEPDTWKSKHQLVWEQENGPVTPGNVVIFANGDRAKIEIENLMLVSRSELMIMNKQSLITSSAAATRVGLTIAKVILTTASLRKGVRV